MGQFALDLKKFGQLTSSKMLTVVRKTALELLRGVVLNTPVDTGRARANWQVSLGAPADSEVGWEGYTPGAVEANGAAAAAQALKDGAGTIQKAKAEVAIYLSNNLPYIERLENGWSQQAPAGMVRITIARFPYLVEQAAK